MLNMENVNVFMYPYENQKYMGRSASLFDGHMAGNLTWPPNNVNFVARPKITFKKITFFKIVKRTVYLQLI